MRQNPKITNAKQFFDFYHPKQLTFMDNLSLALKKSYSFIASTLSKIDFQFIKKDSNNQCKANDRQSFQNQKNVSEQQKKHKDQLNRKRKLSQQQFKLKEELSKKQMLKQKKESKLISFDKFQKENERKINESFILRELKKGKERRKYLSRSMSLNANNLSKDANNVSNKEDLKYLNTNKLLGEDLTNGQTYIQKQRNHQLKTGRQKRQNESLILNISDISAGSFNFNPLNNSFLSQNEKQQSKLSNNQNKSYYQSKGPVLRDYPIPIYATLGFERLVEGKYYTEWDKQRILRKSKPRYNLQRIPYSKYYQIDVDVEEIDEYGSKIRKKIKKTCEYLFETEEQRQYYSKDESRYYQRFDSKLSTIHTKMLEELRNAEQQKKKQVEEPLRKQFNKFFEQNFASVRQKTHNLKKVSNQSLKQPMEQVYPVDMDPNIIRKKLCQFKKQCQSKINVQECFLKSVTQYKEKQEMEQIIRQEEEVQKEKIRLQIQLENKKRQEQRLKRVMEETQRQRILKEEEEKRQKESQQRQKQSGQLIQQNQELTQLKNKKEKSNLNITLAPTTTPFSLDAPQALQQAQSKQSSVQQKKIPRGEVTEGETANPSLQPNVFPASTQIPITVKQTQSSDKEKVKKYNPFLQSSKKPSLNAPSILQKLVSSQNQETMKFKSTLQTSGFPQPSQNTFLSPVRMSHNASFQSNQSNAVDSSMCEQQQSNITPISSQTYGNVSNQTNLNASVLSSSLNNFGAQMPSDKLSNKNSINQTAPGINNIGSNLFANSLANSGSVFNNLNPSIGGMPFQNNNVMQAVSQIPSFMKNNPSSLFNMGDIAIQNATSLFSQKSPQKNDVPTSLFAAPSQKDDKKGPQRTKSKNKDQRVRF